MQNISTLATTIERISAVMPIDDPDLAADLRANIDDIVAEAHRRWHGTPEADVAAERHSPAHLASGTLHADRMQHPADALYAAEIIFDEFLPTFIADVGATSLDDVIRATRALHGAVWHRFPAGAVAYTESLRQRVSTANLDARAQVARELHDRVAHSLLAGLQRVDLAAMSDAGSDEALLSESASLLRAALRDMQTIAVALHARVGDDPLDTAVARHVRDLFPGSSAIAMSSHGVPVSLPSWLAEEALAIVLEALMNWAKHADGSNVAVRFDWRPGTLRITVSDDGPGFDPDHTPTDRLGQQTMRERAAVVGGTLDVLSAPGAGTVVRLTVPVGHP
jgi:signal transduction histidine kinase